MEQEIINDHCESKETQNLIQFNEKVPQHVKSVLDEKFKEIDETITTISEISENEGFFGSLQEANDLEDKKIKISNYTKIILSILGILESPQGTSKVRLSKPSDSKNLENSVEFKNFVKLKKSIIEICNKLYNSNDSQSLPKSEIETILDKYQYKENYQDIVQFLSILNIATSAGKGRIGGIKVINANNEQKSFENAQSEINKAQGDEEKEKAKRKAEHTIYPIASKILTDLGYFTYELGASGEGKGRRLPGEWNTPDVIGYRDVNYNVMGGMDIEVVTIEVKWDISKWKSYIAETESHQQFSNKSYLMVAQYYNANEFKELLETLSEKGIGLICLKEKSYKDIDNELTANMDSRNSENTKDSESTANKENSKNLENAEFYIHLPAKRTLASKDKIDAFLNIVLSDEEKKQIKERIVKKFIADFIKPVFDLI